MRNSAIAAAVRHTARPIILSLAAIAQPAAIAVADEPQHFKPPVKTIEAPRTADANARLFAENGYDLAGVRESKRVRRICLQDIPLDMSSVQPVQAKKELFIRILLPLTRRSPPGEPG